MLFLGARRAGVCLAEEVLRAVGILPDLDPKGAGEGAQRRAPKVHINAPESRVPQLGVRASRCSLPHT
jgi:hypothetical protein